MYLLILLASIFISCAWYIRHLQNTLDIVKENNTKLEQVAKTNEDTINQLQDNILIQQKLTSELSAKLQEADEAKTVLLKKLQKHDLTKLAAAKPKLIESRINAATTKVFDELELITSD
jgi:peptidoglycan hydrolase CwlO-like protein